MDSGLAASRVDLCGQNANATGTAKNGAGPLFLSLSGVTGVAAGTRQRLNVVFLRRLGPTVTNVPLFIRQGTYQVET